MNTDERQTILLAEDEERARNFLAVLLQTSGYKVITAIDGIDALEKAKEHSGPIPLLLSDIQMPRLTGIELATQLHSYRPETAILLMSGAVPGTSVSEYGWAFVAKPFSPLALIQKIHIMLMDVPAQAV